jgi:uncharacterized protein YjiS (DUF1127 family)
MGTARTRAGAKREGWPDGARVSTALARLLAWPIRVYRARLVLRTLAALGDRELRDIGLTRQDLRDANALPLDADPSSHLRRRAEGRRRRR